VKLIAGQLAVSLDNALLYATLEKKVADRTAELGEANRSLQRLIEQRESELRATGALKAALVDHAQEAIVITNEAGVIVEFNPAAQAMFGMPRDRMLGRGPEVLMPTRYGHLAPQVLQQLENGEIFGQRWALQGLRADGSEFPAEVVLWSVQVEGMLHYAASVRDVTEQRQNEQTLERQRADLRQSEKLTLMGSLLAGVAHELNNPLAVVMGRASLIEERCRGTDMQQEAHRIGEAAQRCGRIVKTFLNMARRREPVRAAVKLNDVVVGATDLLGYLLRTHQVEMVLDLGDSLPDVWGDADQLTQVVVNLIVNAQQAMESMPNGRQLRLSTGWQPGAHEQPSKVWLRASDSGPGVPAELAEKIFQPFFTTKSNGQGTGLGLAMSHSIAREHGGDLVLEASSAGASFCCWLPALSD
jgi:two-component system NtrC family sensor kinase